MYLTNLPVSASFGDVPDQQWRESSPVPTGHDEDSDTEDASEDDKSFVKSTLGFDPSELFKEDKP